jgi:hypothetical protein
MRTIKHLLAITSVFLFCLDFAHAQANFGEFKWGFKGGANFANFNNLEDAIEEKKGKVGFVAGGFAKIPLSQNISIRPELLFNMKGASFNFSDTITGDLESSYRLNYIEIPISLDFDVLGLLDLHLGVQGSYLLSKQFKLGDTKIDLDDDLLQKGEFGIHIGGGIDLGNLGIHARFQQSLSSFSKESDDEFDPRNWGVSVAVSYMLN